MKISIIGASGYTGAELLRLLHNHPQAEITYLSSQTNADSQLSLLYPHLLNLYKDKFVTMEQVLDNAKNCDIIFTALPHGHAMKIGKAIETFKTRMIDIGADYRLKDFKIYEEHYKVKHTHNLAKAVYGLSEIKYKEIKTAKIVANPGCYPTASILALYPLLKDGLIETNSIIIDAVSGTTGAGRALRLSSHFSEVFENFTAYGVTSHRHTPEIEEYLSEAAKEKIKIIFTPHLAPMARGILATCYAELKKNVSANDIENSFGMYKEKYFIRLLGNVSPATKNTRGSNYADIGWFIDKRTNRIIVLSAIDNLVKGASGQAVENMNIMFGLDEKTGLDIAPIYP
ncbi:MAG: N-acetyl-gamma-glutamyl-phosphate reductase [Elusimicrobiota bacterium]|jgi:N-acetyl-gamma-glutamyl-phosphate reductase|nr:N-acetyl-gamma-glutamyl-phosphate reductase [Elusimicrobiota bacterium]